MYNIYQVQNGDTLASIARMYGTTDDFLIAINGFPNNYILTPGMNIVVPSVQNEIFFKYIVQKGDNLYSIATKYGIDLDYLIMINGLNKNDYIYPNQELIVPNKNVGIFLTKDGDTINSVLEKLNISINDLLNQNANIYLMPEQLIIYKKENLY